MAASAIAINGRTSVLGILGHPLGHARSPALINAALAETRRDAVYVPMDVSPTDLARLLNGLRGLCSFKGAVVTMPHKQAIVPLLDELTPEAEQVGAANVIRREADGRMIGTMLDGEGFVVGLREHGHDVRGRRVYLAGAGGAAAGVAFALARHGVVALTIYNRTIGRAADLAARVQAAWPTCDARTGSEDPSGHALVINATSLGLRPDDPLPFRVDGLTADVLAADVVIRPERTPFLEAARERGCVLHDGEPMLRAQLPLMIEFMLGREDAAGS